MNPETLTTHACLRVMQHTLAAAHERARANMLGVQPLPT